MTKGITIRLDASALTSLIQDDPQFKLELQRAVVAEVVRNLLMKDAPTVVKAVMPTAVGEVVAQLRDDATFQEGFANHLRLMLVNDPQARSTWNAKQVPSPELVAKIKEQVDYTISTTVQDQIKASGFDPEETIAKLWATFEKWLETEVPGRIRHDVDIKVRRAIEEGVSARLAEIKAQLG